jgi:hypothetical protein
MAKKGKKAKVTCLGCGSRMKGKDVACRRCGHMREGTMRHQPGAAKAVFQPADGPAFLAKAARPRCGRCGNASRYGAKHCTSCGAALLSVVKSAADTERDRYMALLRASPDPVLREGYWELAQKAAGHVYGKGTAS